MRIGRLNHLGVPHRPPRLHDGGHAGLGRMLAAFSPPGMRQLEFFIAEEGASAVAYVVISRGPEGPVIEEWGDRDPAGARFGAMLQVLAWTGCAPLPPWPPLGPRLAGARDAAFAFVYPHLLEVARAKGTLKPGH